MNYDYKSSTTLLCNDMVNEMISDFIMIQVDNNIWCNNIIKMKSIKYGTIVVLSDTWTHTVIKNNIWV